MRVYRVFVPALTQGERVLTGSEAQHLAQVLRVQPGARVRAFDGQGLEADGTVAAVAAAVEGPRVTLTLGEPYAREVEAALRVTLAVALLKGDKLTEVVRRGTELGVARFLPFVSRRCDVRALSPNKLVRLRRVAQEAAKQSGRNVVPPVAEAAPLADLSFSGPLLVAHPDAPRTLGETLRALLPGAPPEAVTVLTGPEGGLTGEELDALARRGAHPVRLGARILRAETAPVALAAALLIPEAL